MLSIIRHTVRRRGMPARVGLLVLATALLCVPATGRHAPVSPAPPYRIVSEAARPAMAPVPFSFTELSAATAGLDNDAPITAAAPAPSYRSTVIHLHSVKPSPVCPHPSAALIMVSVLQRSSIWHQSSDDDPSSRS